MWSLKCSKWSVGTAPLQENKAWIMVFSFQEDCVEGRGATFDNLISLWTAPGTRTQRLTGYLILSDSFRKCYLGMWPNKTCRTWPCVAALTRAERAGFAAAPSNISCVRWTCTKLADSCATPQMFRLRLRAFMITQLNEVPGNRNHWPRALK
jgi:hypothetical protein